VGRCRGDAAVGSYFGQMKCEAAGSAMFDPKAEARAEVSECLGVSSDRVRLHSSPGLACPAEYERAYRQKHR